MPVAEDSQGGACVVCCGSKRCKTCDHIFVGSTFTISPFALSLPPEVTTHDVLM